MRRRDFLGALAAPAVAGAASARPNILLILADDMGFSDLGCYGSEIPTPNLDRLAAGGIRFTHFYNTARCCPTRAALMTGLYNHQAGVGHMNRDFGRPGYRGFLNDRCVTIAEALRPAGYRTLHSGKWHLGEARPNWPCDRGFDHFWGLLSGGSNYFHLEEGRKMAIDDRPYTPSPEGFYMTDAFTDAAVRFLRDYGKGPQPFFLYLAYTAPHWPLQAWPDDIARFRGKYRKGWDRLRQERYERQLASGIIERRWRMAPRGAGIPAWDSLSEADRDDWDLRMAVYAAQVWRMDYGIGKVIDALRATGQMDNTLVLFLSDNGASAETSLAGRERPGPPGPGTSFTSYGPRGAHFSNTPFRLYKRWVQEGGIATPLIAHWPGRIRARGRMVHEPAHIIDVMATCLEVGRARYPETRQGKPVEPLAGRSFLSLLEGGRRTLHDALYWEHEGNRAMREGKWKLVAEHRRPWELYDMEADRTEWNDLAARDPGRVARMERMWQAWAARSNVVPWEELPG